jgi:hypothetical protein
VRLISTGLDRGISAARYWRVGGRKMKKRTKRLKRKIFFPDKFWCGMCNRTVPKEQVLFIDGENEDCFCPDCADVGRPLVALDSVNNRFKSWRRINLPDQG